MNTLTSLDLVALYVGYAVLAILGLLTLSMVAALVALAVDWIRFRVTARRERRRFDAHVDDALSMVGTPTSEQLHAELDARQRGDNR